MKRTYEARRPKHQSKLDQAITIPEAAALLGCRDQAIWQWVRAGKVATFTNYHDDTVLISWRSLVAYRRKQVAR